MCSASHDDGVGRVSTLYPHIPSDEMSDRALNVRHSRVSPVPGRGSVVAYSQCPDVDPDAAMMAGNVLAIPMSSINTNNINNNHNNSGSTNALIAKNVPGKRNL